VDEGLRVPKRGTGYGQAAGLLGSVLLQCWAVTGIRERLSSLAAGRQSRRSFQVLIGRCSYERDISVWHHQIG